MKLFLIVQLTLNWESSTIYRACIISAYVSYIIFLNSIDENNEVQVAIAIDVIYSHLDFTKTFNLVPHNILLLKRGITTYDHGSSLLSTEDTM